MEVSHFIQKDDPAVGNFKQSFVVGHSASEPAFHAAEQLAHREISDIERQ
jgi:hypothetical protein